MNLFVFADKFTGIKRGMVRSSSWVSSKTFSWSGWKALGQPPTVGICSSRGVVRIQRLKDAGPGTEWSSSSGQGKEVYS